MIKPLSSGRVAKVLPNAVLFQFPFPRLIENAVFFEFPFPGVVENAVFIQFPFPGMIENVAKCCVFPVLFPFPSSLPVPFADLMCFSSF